MVDGLAGARPDDLRLVAEAGDGQAEVAARVRTVAAADVARLDALERVPDARVAGELRRVARELLQAQPLGSTGGEEGLDRLGAVDRGAVPEHQQLAGEVAQQVREEAHDVR